MKLALVVQRCGKEVIGGAEALTLMLAKRLAAEHEVEILTTCALDYMTWDNHYAPGLTIEEGIRIRRFPTDRPRDVAEFNAMSEKVLAEPTCATIPEGEAWMRSQGPMSSQLMEYIGENRTTYDAFVFSTYLYATTYFGLQLVDSPILVPNAHDEPPIYLAIYDRIFRHAAAIAYNTEEEHSFLEGRFPGKLPPGEVIAVGIEEPAGADAARFRIGYGIAEPFILYVGRIDESKGCGELFELFIKYKAGVGGTLKLVLAGKAVMPIPDHQDIVFLGFIEDQTKYDAIAACELLVNPSHYESLSLVLLEAWYLEKPVLVTARSEVMVGQCRRSGGGLWYDDYDTFRTLLNDVILGRFSPRGTRKYVEERYAWPVIVAKYRELLSRVRNARPRPLPTRETEQAES